jgi:hypothetical protein
MFSTSNGPDLRTHRQPNGNQNFLSMMPPTDGAPTDPIQRLALIDQLLAANSGNSAATAALNQARARLSSPAAR